MDAVNVANDVMAQAEQDEAAAFNLQHALAKEGERAANQILADGDERKRRIAAALASQARVDPDAARFALDDDDDTPDVVAPAPAAADAPTRVSTSDEDDEPPGRWLT